MPTNQQFKPTSVEETTVGGSTSFGAEPFVPNINNGPGVAQPTGTTAYTATLQRVGRILFFHIVLEGATINFGIGHSLILPRSPSRYPAGHALAGQLTGVGMAIDSVTGVILQNMTTGTFLTPNAPVAGPYRISGWYWVD